MFWHIDTDIISLLVMCALYYYMKKTMPESGETARNRGFLLCLRIGILMTCIDIAASVAMDVPTTRFLYHLFMTAYLLTQDLAIVAWLLYGLTILYADDEKSRRRIAAGVWGLYAAYALLALSNPWTKLFYSLGPDLAYTRGPLFLPGLVGLYALYALGLLVLTYLRWKRIPPGYPRVVLVLQPVLLGVAIPVQLLNPGWLMIFPAYMLCLVLAFLFFQNIRTQNERIQLRQLTEMVEHFACGLSICRITGDGKLEAQYLSGGLAAVYEAGSARLLSNMRQDILTGVHPSDRGMVEAKLEEMIGKRKDQEIIYRLVTDGGKLKWIHFRGKVTEQQNGEAAVYGTYTDLTELKKAEQMIDVALKNTGVSIWEYDFHRRCIIQYQNSTEMHGFETVVPNVPESLVESGFVHPDSAAAFLAMYDRLFAGAPFAEGVFKVQTSDRKGYWYEHIRYTNALDENGNPYSAVGMSTDETERQEAIYKYERELEKERGVMVEEGIIAHATFDLTAGIALDYRYRDGSPVPEADRTAFIYGRENGELLINGEERARFLRFNDTQTLLDRFAAGETDFRMEYRRRIPDGSVIWVRNTMRMLRDPRSGNILLFAYWYDIEAEKMLELMYRSVATDNYDFVARIDGRTKRFETLEKAGLTYHMPPHSGEDADEVTLRLYDDCVAPEDRGMAVENSLVETVHRHLQEYGRYVFTYRMTRPDGSMRYKKITQYYIDPERRIIAMMREDITDLIHEETEKSRVLSEALEAANQASRAKSQFLSRVSHELRTPLNAIIGFMELAKDADEERTAAYLAHSDAAAKQLLSIINDVLDVSSIESGKMRIAHAPFDFKHLIQNITDLYVSQCGQKGLGYETLLLTPVDEWLIGDQLRVNQILLNLLNNALKFTAEGRVSLQISQRPIRGDRVMLRFVVSDTGCGMGEEMQKRLFRPFEQESAVTAQKYGGSGLGLSIVGSLVNMMDGVVAVESVQGKGSAFTVDIPFHRSEADAFKGTLEGAESLHVLVADDEPLERTYVSAVLSRLGVRHKCVHNGEEALEELERAAEAGDAYNVCLVDWKMPDMNGLETTRRIRLHYRQDLVVIIVSAYDHYQAEESAKAAGANLFIPKPLFQSSLFDLFATLTGGRITRPEGATAPLSLKEMRILLVEDNSMNRMVAENIIQKKFGARCECAEDGRIALEKFLASPKGYYDGILMDIQMPNMDGYEATRRIRASDHPDAREVQIIALTANAFSEDVTKSLASGMNAHVSKPIEPDVLGETLAHAFRQKRGK